MQPRFDKVDAVLAMARQGVNAGQIAPGLQISRVRVESIIARWPQSRAERRA